jgi:hypothetical protein
MREGNLLLRWIAAALAASALLAASGAEPAGVFPLPVAFVFWLAHVGLGLSTAIGATRQLSARFSGARAPQWLLLLVGGLVGSLLFAPVALAIDGLFPSDGDADDPLWLLALGRAGMLGALGAEWLQLLPTYVLTWVLINVAPFLKPEGEAFLRNGEVKSIALDPPPVEAPKVQLPESSTEPLHGWPTPQIGGADGAPPAVIDDGGEVAMALDEDRDIPSAPHGGEAAAALFDRLPPAIGRDIVTVQSDLHYLHVRTLKGQATLLGALSELDGALGDAGLRVHRSFWVARKHVKRVIRSAKGWHCEMRDGRRVPVARRRQVDVREFLGKDFVVIDE